MDKRRMIWMYLGLAFLLRLVPMTQNGLSFDEAFSYFVSKENPTNLLAATLSDNHPPFYFLLLSLWIRVLGKSEISLRFPSLIFDLASLAIAFKLFAKLLGKNTSNKIILFMALSPVLISFSTQARMYSLLTFSYLVLSYLALVILEKRTFIKVLLFILLSTLAIYTHYYGVLIILSILAVTIFKKRLSLKWNFLPFLIPTVLGIPLLYFYTGLSHPGAFVLSNYKALPGTLTSLIFDSVGALKILRTDPTLTFLLISISLVFLIIFICGVRKCLKNVAGKTLIMLFAIPIAILTLINFFIPVFSIRSIGFVTPFFLAILVVGIESLKRGNLLRLCLSAMTLLTLIFLSGKYSKGPEIKNALANLAREETIYHTSILTYYPFEYYDQKKNNFLLLTNPLSAETESIIGGRKTVIQDNAERIVLVDSFLGADPIEVEEVLTKLKGSYTLIQVMNFREIRIYFFTLPRLPTKI